MFYFGPTDTKQEDKFVKNFPVCKEDSPIGRRRWFNHVMTHGTQHDIYIHDMYCFWTLTLTTQLQQSEYRGFTVGSEKDDEQFDLLEQLSIQLTCWSGKLHLALSKSGIFPAGGTTEDYIASKSLKDGYALLLKISKISPPILSIL